jgi:hypothetical protein
MKTTPLQIGTLILASIVVGCNETRKPMTYADVMKKKEISFPFPASSSNIFYDFKADWQLLSMNVRFDAPVTDCVRHIDAVFAWNDVIEKRTSSYSCVHFTNAALLDTSWGDSAAINKISNGIHAGKNSSHSPEIWVDLDKGIFYFHISD